MSKLNEHLIFIQKFLLRGDYKNNFFPSLCILFFSFSRKFQPGLAYSLENFWFIPSIWFKWLSEHFLVKKRAGCLKAQGKHLTADKSSEYSEFLVKKKDRQYNKQINVGRKAALEN